MGHRTTTSLFGDLVALSDGDREVKRRFSQDNGDVL